jgi:hypothetical protein
MTAAKATKDSSLPAMIGTTNSQGTKAELAVPIKTA